MQVITIGFLLIQLSIAGSYEQRFGKSLTASGSFPFAAAHHGDHGDNHEHHHEHHESHHQAHTGIIRILFLDLTSGFLIQNMR